MDNWLLSTLFACIAIGIVLIAFAVGNISTRLVNIETILLEQK